MIKTPINMTPSANPMGMWNIKKHGQHSQHHFLPNEKYVSKIRATTGRNNITNGANIMSKIFLQIFQPILERSNYPPGQPKMLYSPK